MTSRQDTPTIAAIGMFDGVHAGHRDLARRLCARAKELGYRSLALTFDRHPLELVRPEWAPRLLTLPEERRRLLQECGIDEVVTMTFDNKLRQLTARQYMERIGELYGVRAIVMGYDHHFGSDRLKDIADYQAIGTEMGIDISRCPEYRVPGLDMTASSSTVRRLLESGDVSAASLALERPYSITGKVVSGRRLGNTIGFPTANLEPDARILVPASGVYAGSATVDGMTYPTMINIGTCPTVTDGNRRTIEANLIGYDGNLYDTELTVSFEKLLRDEQRFASLPDLIAQLNADRESTLRYFADKQ